MTQEWLDKEIDLTLLSGNVGAFSGFVSPRAQAQIESGQLSALGAISDGVACGAIVYDFANGAVDIKSIVVAPDYRRQHIGTTLFCELADFFEADPELDAHSITIEYPDDGSGAYEFFQSLGFEQTRSENKTVSVQVSRLNEGVFAERSSQKGSVLPLSQLSPAHVRALDVELDRRGANFTGESISEGNVLAELSMVYYENNEPAGCLCFSPGSGPDELILSVFFIGTQSIAAIMAMLNASLEAIRSGMGADTVVKIPLVMPSAVKLAERLLSEHGQTCDTLVNGVFALNLLTEDDGE